MKEGSLNILAARPGMGKTAMAISVALNLANREKRSLFYSLEMSAKELAMRALVAQAGMSQSRSRLKEAKEALDNGFMVIKDTPSLTPLELRSSVMLEQFQNGPVDLVIVDYLQIMGGEGKSTYEIVSNISTALKGAARGFKTPILCLAQITRAVESRTDKRPLISDLRDSGKIEEDADTISLLYRPRYYDRSKGDETEINVGKNRHGEVGVAVVNYNQSGVCFEDYIRSYPYEASQTSPVEV